MSLCNLHVWSAWTYYIPVALDHVSKVLFVVKKKFRKVRAVQRLSLQARTGPEKVWPGPPHVGCPPTEPAHARALSSVVCSYVHVGDEATNMGLHLWFIYKAYIKQYKSEVDYSKEKLDETSIQTSVSFTFLMKTLF